METNKLLSMDEVIDKYGVNLHTVWQYAELAWVWQVSVSRWVRAWKLFLVKTRHRSYSQAKKNAYTYKIVHIPDILKRIKELEEQWELD